MDPARRKKLEGTTRYEPAEVEARIFAEWIEGGYFHPEAGGDPAENYSVAIPPPNVTGVLHMGHALNGSMQDALVRMNRMRGRNTLWTLGTDHAGIATQAVVEKGLAEEGVSRHELGREAFVERVWAWKEEYGSRIVEQYKRLGASLDYENERFTLDEGYVRAVYRVFKLLYDKGYIYRDNYMVNWDPGSHSAISDLEVENREVEDTLYSIDYPVEGSDRVLTVATVRPETMLADTAVAVNPDDARHADLSGKHCVLPLVGRRLPIVADEHVDPEFGTGALKVTPGHDPNDFEIGRRHGLEEIGVIGPDGRMNEEAGERFAGMAAADAGEAVVVALREEGRLRDEEPYVHSVPFSERSGARIEPLISLQWFCRMDELAAPAIDVVEREEVRITPPQWKRVYLDWMREIRPWCISRQLWWGHRIPVWYCDACEETIVAEEAPERCGACGGPLRQEEDVLDTWFSSALWPFATLGWPEDTPELRAFYPTSFLTTAREILFLWVARMIMTGIEFAGDVPFRDVYVHSVIQARDGRRMSKSLGTGIDPLEEIDEHGADALRFGLLAMSSTQDVRFSDAKVQQGADLANKLWNASRLILLNVAEVEAAPRPVSVEDRWLLSRLEATIASVTAKLEEYDFAHATQEAYAFFWSELCDWYLEIVKPRLYEGEAEVSATLLWTLERILALLHPIMPFVSEEIWSYHPARQGHLAVHSFPEADESLLDPAAEREVRDGIELTGRLRAWRDLVEAPAATVLSARAEGAAPPEFVGRLARCEFVDANARLRSGREESDMDAPSAPSRGDGGDPIAAVGSVKILASAEIDAEAVAARLEARRKELRSEVARAEGKLGNEKFVDRAPAEVVEEERQKLVRYRAELEELSE
ncbi:MAG TPA: valine--tRNA ligase [Solirubrobacterales bacterium]|nr:valine--tRNA ligase [Solirubrobacterales bacterium]